MGCGDKSKNSHECKCMYHTHRQGCAPSNRNRLWEAHVTTHLRPIECRVNSSDVQDTLTKECCQVLVKKGDQSGRFFTNKYGMILIEGNSLALVRSNKIFNLGFVLK